MGAVWEVLSKLIRKKKAFSAKSTFEAKIWLSLSIFAMKTFSLSLGILLSLLLLLLVSFCNAAEKNVAEFKPGQGGDEITKNGAVQGEKFKFLSHHKPHYKKPFFNQIPHPIVKKPIPHHPILKKPLPKPHFPPVFPTNP